VKLDFLAELAVFHKSQFTFAFCIHINFVPGCNVILVFTNGTVQSDNFAGSLFCHEAIVA
jgi:hypothetical protein